jgi:7-keto-8-aminopelargonate synthetase-like enzyme
MSFFESLHLVAPRTPAPARPPSLTFVLCVLYSDEGVNFCIQQGILLSRANVLYFKHNNVDDLKATLEQVKKRDEATGSR